MKAILLIIAAAGGFATTWLTSLRVVRPQRGAADTEGQRAFPEPSEAEWDVAVPTAPAPDVDPPETQPEGDPADHAEPAQRHTR